jgi:acyl transferase domain-containing protein
LDETLAAAAPYWPDDLRRVLWDDDEAWHRVDAQPALVALQIALGRYWRAVGLEPRLLLGHSLGEYAAACLAGVLTLSDTLRLVCARAQLLRDRCAPGRMLVVLAPEAEVRPLVEPWAEHVAIAAVNGPRQTVLAGTAAALAALEPQLTARSWRCRPLTTTHAFHSPLVEPMLEAFRQVAEQVSYQRPQWPYVSSLTGTWAQEEVASADYWCRHLRHTVRFHDALQCARAAAPAVYLEVGAGSTLAALVRGTLRAAAPCVRPGLRGDDQEWTEHLTTLGQLYVRGTPLRWPQVWGAPHRKVTLPSYPFQRQRYWFAAAAPAPSPALPSPALPGTALPGPALPSPALPGPVVHPLLGRRLDLAGHEIIYETDLRGVAYLADHRLDGVPVFPTTGYLELALAAGREAGFKLLDVRDLKIRRPLALGADQSGRVQVVLTPDGSGLACRILRAAPGKWHTHATCRLEAEPEEGAAESWVAPQGAPRSVAAHYARCRERGLDYGPAFQGLEQLTGAAGQAWGVVVLPALVDPHGYLVHPALLDACLQVIAAALPDQPAHTWLPVRVRRYRLLQADEPITQLHVHAVARQSTDGNSFLANMTATDAQGEHVLIMDELQLRRIERRNARESETTAARDSVTSARANIAAEIMA